MLGTIQLYADHLISFFNVFGPVLGYAPQYFEMDKQRSVGSFSKFICIIMIVAHTLRLQFYLLKPYHFSLFLQSFFMFFIQSTLLYKFYEMLEYESKLKSATHDPIEKTEERESMIHQSSPGKTKLREVENNTQASESFPSFLSEDSFQLDDMPKVSEIIANDSGSSRELKQRAESTDASLVEKSGQESTLDVSSESSIRERHRSSSGDKKESLIMKSAERHLKYVPRFRKHFVGTLSKVSLLLGGYFLIFLTINQLWFAEVTAMISVSCEALLPIIQFVSNFQKKSVHSLSFSMILCWFVGDTVKLYFLLRNSQPSQFILSTVTIITFDLLILIQFHLYGKKTPSKK